MVLRDSRFGPFYGCSRFPRCQGTAAVHKDGSLKSTPADPETKRKRIRAHEVFDGLWQNGLMTRSQAYEALSEHMKLSKEDTHIGYFDRDQCVEVLIFAGNMIAQEIEHQRKHG